MPLVHGLIMLTLTSVTAPGCSPSTMTRSVWPNCSPATNFKLQPGGHASSPCETKMVYEGHTKTPFRHVWQFGSCFLHMSMTSLSFCCAIEFRTSSTWPTCPNMTERSFSITLVIQFLSPNSVDRLHTNQNMSWELRIRALAAHTRYS